MVPPPGILIFGFLSMCSLMVLGIPLIALTMAAKGFLVGFTVGVLALNLGAGGFLAIVVCIFLSNLVLIPCTLKAGVLGLGNERFWRLRQSMNVHSYQYQARVWLTLL